ncbi:MAG: glycosyltransferase family 2 protein [Candidatus Omnitrophota bacterium]
MTPKISAVVMIYNEEAQIRECLETIKWVDEIVICDSFSTDRTVEICREYTDKIYQRVFDNFGNQKRWLMDKPSHEWVLFVEADERFPQALADEIRSRLAAGEGYDGYWMPFRNFVFSQEMKGSFWIFKKVKLYKKDRGGWEDKLVHAGFILNGKAGELRNAVLHYPYPDMNIMLLKLARAMRLEAQQLIEKKARVGPVDTLKALYWIPARFYIYFFKLGDYKSGLAGLIFSAVTSFYIIGVNIQYWNIKLCSRAR